MEDLFKQLGNQAFSGLMGGFGGAGDFNENEEDEQPLEQEDLMENAKLTYEIFIQNSLRCTTHSIQWLPARRDEP